MTDTSTTTAPDNGTTDTTDTTATNGNDTATNGSNKYLVLGLVMVTSFITPFIGAAVNLALPHIRTHFSMDTLQMSWVVMAYILSSAVFLVPMGKAADILGRKRVFFWGNIVVAASSALCILAPTGAALIAFRVLQGVGSSMVFATGVALVTSVFPPHERGKALGLSVTAVYAGLSAAPVIGGFLISWFDWTSLFYVPILVGAPSAIITRVAIRQEWAQARHERFDYLGAAVYVPSMTLFMYGFSQLPALWAVALSVLGAAGLVLFIAIELRAQSPVLNVHLFRTNRLFAFANLAALINYATTFAVTFMLSLYLQDIKGFTPRAAGLVLVTQPLLMALVASWAGRLSDRIDPRILASSGMGLSALGLLLLVPLNAATPTPYLVFVLGVLGLAFGIFSSPNTNSIMGSVEPRLLGVASGTVGTMRLTGQMVSMGIATLILHTCIGPKGNIAAQHDPFVLALQITFIVFAALSGVGIWASLKRGKTTPAQSTSA